MPGQGGLLWLQWSTLPVARAGPASCAHDASRLLPRPPAPQVLDAALALLHTLCCADLAALAALCQLGFCPAVLRFAQPPAPLDIRLQVHGGVWVGQAGCGLCPVAFRQATGSLPPCAMLKHSPAPS